ncbi:hypothetical protein BHM03_00049898 [Ensete ventricosum]|nr:hypothetical protein BHM03_00049898 [Ensete ventricosum]
MVKIGSSTCDRTGGIGRCPSRSRRGRCRHEPARKNCLHEKTQCGDRDRTCVRYVSLYLISPLPSHPTCCRTNKRRNKSIKVNRRTRN